MRKIFLNFERAILFFVFSIYRLVRSKNKKSILLYTDSRGTEIYPRYKHKNPFYSYITKSLKNYKVYPQLCPHKYTSLLDFLYYIEKNSGKYDFIVLHCGIVDFAPRPLSSYKAMLSEKVDYIKSKEWMHYFENRTDYLCDYESEKCIHFMSEKFLKNEIIPLLKEFKNIIYVGINPVLNDWDGSYWRKRPQCINEQLKLDSIMMSAFDNKVDLSHFDDVTVRKFTVDNIHYNESGLVFIGNAIFKELNKLEISKSET